MAHPLVSRRKAMIISFSLFLIGLATLTYFKSWWPGIMLAIGLPLAVRQHLLGRQYDMWVSLFVFIGVFVTVQFDISWEVLLPTLFTLGGIYIVFREFIENSEIHEEEEEEDINLDLERKKRRKK